MYLLLAMNLKALILSLFIRPLSPCTSGAQEVIEDSIWIRYKSLENDTMRIDYLIKQSWNNVRVKPYFSLQLLDTLPTIPIIERMYCTITMESYIKI